MSCLSFVFRSPLPRRTSTCVRKTTHSIVCSTFRRTSNTVYRPLLPHRRRPLPVVNLIRPRVLVEVPFPSHPSPTSRHRSILPLPHNSMFTPLPLPWNIILPSITRPAHHLRTEHQQRAFISNISVRIVTRSMLRRTTRMPPVPTLPLDITSRFWMFIITIIIMLQNSILVILNTIQHQQLR